jgi:hypothetical protein
MLQKNGLEKDGKGYKLNLHKMKGGYDKKPFKRDKR